MTNFKPVFLSRYRLPVQAFPALAGVILGTVWANTSAASVTQLAPIVVTASASERLLEDAPASVTVLSCEELSRRPIYDVAQAVEGTPGVHLSSVGINGKGI